jgi:hypothetical protein
MALFYPQFLQHRRDLAAQGDFRSSRLRDYALPVIEHWMSGRGDNDPVTGRPIFVAHVERRPDPAGGEPIPTTIVLEAFDGSTLTFAVDVPRDAIVITDVVAGEEGEEREFVTLNGTTRLVEGITLVDRDGGQHPLVELLNAFEQALFGEHVESD